MNKNIKAIFWDYDGTLVDTAYKNYNITIKIIRDVLNTDPKEFPILNSLESYRTGLVGIINWRELYESVFGFSPEETDYAGSYWTPMQIEDKTPTPLFDGISNVVKTYSDTTQGIVSQNSSQNITNVIQRHGIKDYFDFIVGYEDVNIRNQKPEPEGLLQCINKLPENTKGHIFFIGDHDTDIIFVQNVNNVLESEKRDVKIISIGTLYNNGTSEWTGNTTPDFVVSEAIDIINIISNYQ